MKHEDLQGTTIRFAYSDETYRIELLTVSTLRWTREIGQNVGEGATEQYVASQLSEDMVLITWIEEGGPGLSNVLDFKNLTVTTHANMGRDVFENPGKLLLTNQ